MPHDPSLPFASTFSGKSCVRMSLIMKAEIPSWFIELKCVITHFPEVIWPILVVLPLALLVSSSPTVKMYVENQPEKYSSLWAAEKTDIVFNQLTNIDEPIFFFEALV